MAGSVRKCKRLKLDQRKLDFARRFFGVATDEDAIDRALSLLMDETLIVDRLKRLAGVLAEDEGEWPYG